MTFSDAQKAALAAPLNREHVRTRQQAGRSLSYVEGWLAISEANRIFGFDAWTSETVETRCVAEKPRKIRDRDGWGVSYVARVRVRVGDIVREGVGAGHGIDVDLGLAHESAIKEAETDARKRALMTFGNPFGLALYDKEQRHVEEPERQAERGPVTFSSGREPSGNPVDLQEIVAYVSKARSTIQGMDEPAEIRTWFSRESARRSALGITKDSQSYQDLVDACHARIDELSGRAAA